MEDIVTVNGICVCCGKRKNYCSCGKEMHEKAREYNEKKERENILSHLKRSKFTLGIE